MTKSLFKVNGVGCGLGDIIFGGVHFHSEGADKYHSRLPGDGGLQMGGLVFVHDLMDFARAGLPEILKDLTAGAEPDFFNVGGPALVSLTLASQLLTGLNVPVSYYGLSGNDETAAKMRHILAQTPLNLSRFVEAAGPTPSTFVLSDPTLHGGVGDRCFINDLGVAGQLTPDRLNDDFFQATFILYGGTALVPGIHAHLPTLLRRGREGGALNIVGTVYDFLAEKNKPGHPWGLGEGNAYPFIDLLVADKEEIYKLSGKSSVEESIEFLFERGLNSAIVTQGADPSYFRSRGGVFGECNGYVRPVETIVGRVRNRDHHPGDTTGAGDNFLGAIIASLLHQVHEEDNFSKGEVFLNREFIHMRPLDLRRAVEFATVAGGLACLQFGGTYLENYSGERLTQICAYQRP